MGVANSAGLLMCRNHIGNLEFFLVHPGGPFFSKKDDGSWSIPKGLMEENEDAQSAASREFCEETGISPTPPFYTLGSIRQKSGKVVHAWTFIGAWDPSTGIKCNTFSIEWPPKSGKLREFPEVDRAIWADYKEASRKILPAQLPFLQRAKDIWESKMHDKM